MYMLPNMPKSNSLRKRSKVEFTCYLNFLRNALALRSLSYRKYTHFWSLKGNLDHFLTSLLPFTRKEAKNPNSKEKSTPIRRVSPASKVSSRFKTRDVKANWGAIIQKTVGNFQSPNESVNQWGLCSHTNFNYISQAPPSFFTSISFSCSSSNSHTAQSFNKKQSKCWGFGMVTWAFYQTKVVCKCK